MKKLHHNKALNCRFCGADTFEILDLGKLPLANTLLSDETSTVNTYPTVVNICSECSTSQLNYCADLDVLYKEYAYITPKSPTLTKHYQTIIDHLIAEHSLDESANVLEIGSNIGRFLKHLKPYVSSIVGVDPARNIVEMANKEGVPTQCDFFNAEIAADIVNQSGKMDMIVSRHCFAHNEEPWLMLEGVDELLSDDGIFVIENAYFPDTVEFMEFDQVYHEHMYYYNLRAIQQISQKYGFKLIDCLHSSIHGGTMLYIVKRKDAKGELSKTALQYLEYEKDMHQASYYERFITGIQQNVCDIQATIRDLSACGKSISVYGASAKSATLLNFLGIDSSMISHAVDSSITKQGKYIPLTGIKIISEEQQSQLNPPDYYLLTIWNYKDEIIRKVRESGNTKTRFIIPHPVLEII